MVNAGSIPAPVSMPTKADLKPTKNGL